MTPLFSIITCTFNAENTLERTLQSIESQDFEGRELIIIDGLSTDSTLTIAENHKAIITKLISERDNGLYDAMNKGISRAKGKYLIFLNAGDKFHSNDTLSKVASKLKGDEDIIYGETALVDDEGNFIAMRRLKAPDNLDWKSFRKGMLVCHQSFWVSRELAQNNPYDTTYRYSSDTDWCIRCMKQASTIFNSKETLIDYLNEGMTTNNRWASLKERYRIMSRHYGTVSTMLYHLYFIVRSVTLR